MAVLVEVKVGGVVVTVGRGEGGSVAVWQCGCYCW